MVDILNIFPSKWNVLVAPKHTNPHVFSLSTPAWWWGCPNLLDQRGSEDDDDGASGTTHLWIGNNHGTAPRVVGRAVRRCHPPGPSTEVNVSHGDICMAKAKKNINYAGRRSFEEALVIQDFHWNSSHVYFTNSEGKTVRIRIAVQTFLQMKTNIVIF